MYMRTCIPTLECPKAPAIQMHPSTVHHVLYSSLGDVKWDSFQIQYTGKKPDIDVPSWMSSSYDVWFRDPWEVIQNMLANPIFTGEMDYCPYHKFSLSNDECQWKDFMSGDWAWDQADEISKDPSTIGLTFVPVILGSNKTTVSVGTGNNKYYPLYASINAVAIIGFLAIPKTMCQYATDPRFQKFRHQLFHSSLSQILQTLRPGMTNSENHFHCVIYGLGPYITDYDEQVLLACIVRGWCPRCLAPCDNLDHDALDHFEEGTSGEFWNDYGIVGDLIPFTNDFPCANINKLIAPDILHQLIKGTFKDHLITWVEEYLEVTYRTYEVYLPAIESHVSLEIVQAFHTLLDFCYYVCQNIISETTLMQIQDALASAPNSLCSSITESKHIKAVKEPWQHSSHFNALSQMLQTNQRLDKLAAMQADFTSQGMMNGTAKTVPALTIELGIPQLSALVCQFLFEQLHPNNPQDLSDIPEFQFPNYDASSRFYAPSDIKLEGLQGLDVAHVLCFFSFFFKGSTFPCAVIHWFNTIGFAPNHSPNISIIHIDSIYHAAHLIPVYGTHFISCDLKFHYSYDSFWFYYVNKYADHHAFKIAF
ncbi:hypothetical protein BDR06DRAFT_982727 [Suillus hirtellus]|nr:hypothetical protein BDR06DRAFT_982727 [Suillus hirtellus]